MSLRTLIALGLFLAPLSASAQDWKSFSYPDLGFSVHFPAEPVEATGTYMSLTGASAPTKVYSVRQENVIYTMTVADFSQAPVDQEAAIQNAVKLWERGGTIKVDVVARINTQFGRELSVGRTDGGQSIVAIFYFNNRLYELHGRALPPDPGSSSFKLIRFQQSLSFQTD